MRQRAEYILLADGIPVVFTTCEEIDDTYAASIGFERAVAALQYPTDLAASVELRTGLLDGTSGRFVLEDADGTLPEILGGNEDEAEPLLDAVPAGTTALGASLYSKHIGVEAIGPAGERRRYSCVPGFAVGLEHISENQAYAANLAASLVSDDPVTWDGRRFCLYRLVQNSDGSWPDLTDEDERLAARIYWGTFTGQGQQDGHTWTLSCAGPESWLMRSIGAGFSQVPIDVEVGITINEDAQEHILIGTLDITQINDEANIQHTYAADGDFSDDTLLVGAETYDDVAAAMDSFLDDLQNFNGLVTALVDENGGDTLSRLRYSTAAGDDGIQMRWDRDAFGVIGDQHTLRLRVVAHYKVWKLLGYDPATQNESVDPIENADKFCLFRRPVGNGTTQEAYLTVWGNDYPNHWLGTFFAADAVAMKAKLDGLTPGGDHTDNNGGERRWPPIYAQGTNTFDFSQIGQTLRVKDPDPLFLSASKAVPLPADPADSSSPFSIPNVGNVTHQGIVVFEGPFRDETDPEAEVKKIMLPARVAWRQNNDGSVATEDAWPKLAIYKWPPPRLYGFEDKQPTLWSTWRVPPEDGEPLTMRSLLALEHGSGTDVVAYLYARMLATTGAVGAWSGYGLGGEATLTTGPNDLGITGLSSGLGEYTDAEASTYGLGVPAEMIAISADEHGGLEAALEDHSEEAVYRCKVVLGKVASARDVMGSMLAPTGWCVSLAGGKYGLFDPFTFQAPAAGSGTITAEDIAGTPGEPRSAIPKQRLKVWSAISRIKLSARMNPVTGDHFREEIIRSPDPGQVYRSESKEESVTGPHLIHPLLPNAIGSEWVPSFHARWRKICRFWNRKHFECTLSVPLRRHVEFLPGSVVTITNAWLVNPTGRVYGVTQAPGYVLSRVIDCKGETAEIRCIVDASSVRLYAPAARAVRYDQDEESEGYRLLVDDDYLEIRGNTGTFDVDGFLEPDWSTAGGDTSIEVFSSFDGVTWTGGIYGTIDSVSEAEGGHWLNLTGALTGETWLRDQHHIVVVREHSGQSAAWPLGVFAAIGDKSGEYDGSTLSPRFKD